MESTVYLKRQAVLFLFVAAGVLAKCVIYGADSKENMVLKISPTKVQHRFNTLSTVAKNAQTIINTGVERFLQYLNSKIKNNIVFL